uniref:Uncharacterized protein n=1 Tax=Panagrolaimus sp. JU765 TaxID=591449 RepID=A0AC34QYG1_9BILA
MSTTGPTCFYCIRFCEKKALEAVLARLQAIVQTNATISTYSHRLQVEIVSGIGDPEDKKREMKAIPHLKCNVEQCCCFVKHL